MKKALYIWLTILLLTAPAVGTEAKKDSQEQRSATSQVPETIIVCSLVVAFLDYLRKRQ
ncbi:MAG: hypothetical protein WBB28_18915 [Crinalium sp.]